MDRWTLERPLETEEIQRKTNRDLQESKYQNQEIDNNSSENQDHATLVTHQNNKTLKL